jgi:hypothetical protein
MENPKVGIRTGMFMKVRFLKRSGARLFGDIKNKI